MKYCVFLIIMVLSFVSCKKDIEYEYIQVHDTIQVHDICINHFESRPYGENSIKISWETNDVNYDGCTISIFPKVENFSNVKLDKDVREFVIDNLEHSIIYKIDLIPINRDGIYTTDIVSTKGFLPVFYDDEAWFVNNPVTAHAGGGLIDEYGHEYIYTNSFEAIQGSYTKGVKCFEVDIDFTIDGRPVLVHYWSDFAAMTGLDVSSGVLYDVFKSAKLYGKYSPMTFDDVIDFMILHEDCYFDLDTKMRDPEIWVSYLVDAVKNKVSNTKFSADDILNRFIIEFFSEENYERIDAIYKFKNYFYSLYLNEGESDDNIIKFCIENNIPIVGANCRYFNLQRVRLFKKYNILTICYNDEANDIASCVYAKMREIYGIQSNFVTNEIWNSIKY